MVLSIDRDARSGRAFERRRADSERLGITSKHARRAALALDSDSRGHCLRTIASINNELSRLSFERADLRGEEGYVEPDGLLVAGNVDWQSLAHMRVIFALISVSDSSPTDRRSKIAVLLHRRMSLSKRTLEGSDELCSLALSG